MTPTDPDAPLDPVAPDEACPLTRRRHAAGEDPAKRDQILDGAMKVFFEKGFDAATMNDVCRSAGVSKGTIYVYFADKGDLFETLIGRERERLFLGVDALLETDLPLAERLHAYAVRLATVLCSEHVIRAQRIIIGLAERMPEMGARFYDQGARRAQGSVQRLFEREVAAGRVIMSDPTLAAYQFVELATAGLWRRRLFGKMADPPPPEAVEAVARAAVDVILSAYGGETPGLLPETA